MSKIGGHEKAASVSAIGKIFRPWNEGAQTPAAAHSRCQVK